MKKIAQYIFSIGLTAIFAYLAFAEVEFSALWQAILTVAPQSIVVIVTITLMRIGLRAWRWQFMMRSFADHIGYVVTYLAVAVCYAANVVVPRSGDLLRAVLLGWSDRVPLEPMLGSVAVERIFDVLLLVIFAWGVFTFMMPVRIEAYPELRWSIPLGVAGGLLLLGLMGLFAAGRFGLVLRCAAWISPRLEALVAPRLAAFSRGMGSLRSPLDFAVIAGVSLVMHLSYACVIYAGFWGLGLVEDYGVGVEAALLTVVFSAVSFFVPAPAGIGPYHFFFKEALVVFYAVPPTEALACATVVHATYNLTYLVVGTGAAIAVQGRRWFQDRHGGNAG